MISNNQVKIIHDLILKSFEHSFDNSDSITFRFKSRINLEQELNTSHIVFEKIGADEIRINCIENEGLFYNEEHFLQIVNIDTFKRDIGIISYKNNFLYYDSTNKNTYINSECDLSDNFINNTSYYWKFFEDFSKFELCQYHSSAHREFILISPDKGKFLLGYPSIPPLVSNEINLEDKYLFFQKRNPTQEFRFFSGNK